MHETALARRPPLEAVQPLTGPTVTLAALPPCARWVFRGRPAAVAAIAVPLGFALPQIACRAANAGARAALWLGPDEWLILAPDAKGPAIGLAFANALAGLPHALVYVSHRQAGMSLSGVHAEATLNAGCPLDLDPQSFPVGMCTRTVLGKSQIVLWRVSEHEFRFEASRSFLSYIWRFLEEASREFRDA
jgi:sarcosine oxidase subunit gamma